MVVNQRYITKQHRKRNASPLVYWVYYKPLIISYLYVIKNYLLKIRIID